MKVLPFVVPKPDKGGLIYQVDQVDVFYDKLHQHEEIQLSFIVDGEGNLVVGDTINTYETGDILVIGSHLPHVFKSESKVSQKSHMLTLFFTKQSFGEAFFNLEELNEIQPFFERSKYGFKLKSNLEGIRALFLRLEGTSKLNRFIILLQLLNRIIDSDYTSLSSFVYDKKYSSIEGDRMRNVFDFTLNNYTNDITLEQISRVSNMTKNAFCKYFKKRTNKTYIQFLNEFRIETASKLILEVNDYSIAEIAFKCGFRNISNFNRLFKKIKGVTPISHRKLKI